MKNLKILFGAFLALTFTIACEEEDNLDPVGQWELSEPLLTTSAEELQLDESAPTETFEFQWDPAESSERYQVRYTLVVDSLDSENYNTPILSKTSSDGGRDTKASFTAAELDLALSYAGYEAGSEAAVEVAVIASSLDKQATDTRAVSVKRFETEYLPQQLFLTGAATEAGTDVFQAIPMRALTDAGQNPTHQFEVYTHLEAGEAFSLSSSQGTPAHRYGGSEGELVKNGGAITVAEAGEYRLTVNLEAQTYDLFKIESLGIVGDVIPGGWGGDEPLEYQGNGVWQTQMDLSSGGFVLRFNGDWGYLLKKITGTQNELYMESQAESAGVVVEDPSIDVPGEYLFTLNLQGDTYTYNLESQQTTNPPSETPEALYLLADGATVATFSKDGDMFTSGTYLPLQADVNYQLNSAEDGSGTAYALNGVLGESPNPEGDAVAASTGLLEGEGQVAVARDQAYQLSFNFANGTVSWKYYNIKLFHWDDAGGGWDDRDEFLMTYVHPLQFTTTQNLEAGYAMKFNSPWEVELGADDPTALSGSMTHGGPNFENITTSGTYEVNIEVAEDYQRGTYEFIAQ